jgi:hypothetical protein
MPASCAANDFGSGLNGGLRERASASLPDWKARLEGFAGWPRSMGGYGSVDPNLQQTRGARPYRIGGLAVAERVGCRMAASMADGNRLWERAKRMGRRFGDLGYCHWEWILLTSCDG